MRGTTITFGLVKADITPSSNHTAKILDEIRKNGFKIVKSKTLTLSVSQASTFYASHRAKFFYPRLIRFMTSGPVIALILEKQNAVEEWRKLMGPTRLHDNKKVENSATLRHTFAFSDTRNAVHGSDSFEAVKEEMSFFFPEYNYHETKKE